MGCSCLGNAQIVDRIIGQKRSRVQAMLKMYRIVDYKLEREVHTIENGIHQTVLFENDTCTRFYWAVVPTSMDRFLELLTTNGYVSSGQGFAKDSLLLQVKPLESGKATLFIASLSSDLEGTRDMAGRRKEPTKKASGSYAEQQPMPRLQQAVLEEDARLRTDTVAKKKQPKDPERNWIGTRYGRVSILGWGL